MPVIKVAKPFMVQLAGPPVDPPPTQRPHGGGEVPAGTPVLLGGTEMLYFPEPGEYEVDQDVADHWYTQAHLEGYVPPPPNVPAEVRVMLTTEQAKLKAESDKATADARAKAEADAEAAKQPA
jgi:hypothetical protein